MPRFSTRTFLLAIGVLAVCISALLWPNKIWSTILALVSSIGFFTLIAIAIGAQGKSRLQALSFLAISFLIFFSLSNPELPTSQASDSAISWLRSSLKTVEIKTSKKGEWVRKNNGRLTLYTRIAGRDRSATPIEEEAVKTAGLEPYVYTSWTLVSSDKFRSICRYILAFVFGVFGYVVTGTVYDRRSNHSTESD